MKKRKVRRIKKFKRRGDIYSSFWIKDSNTGVFKICPKCKSVRLKTDMKYVWCSLVSCYYFTKFTGGRLE